MLRESNYKKNEYTWKKLKICASESIITMIMILQFSTLTQTLAFFKKKQNMAYG